MAPPAAAVVAAPPLDAAVVAEPPLVAAVVAEPPLVVGVADAAVPAASVVELLLLSLPQAASANAPSAVTATMVVRVLRIFILLGAIARQGCRAWLGGPCSGTGTTRGSSGQSTWQSGW